MVAFWAPLLAGNLVLALASQTSIPTKGIYVSVLHVSQLGVIDVAINNSGTLPINVWRESNSWGAARWRVLHIGHGQFDIYFQNSNQRFTRNIPSFVQVRPDAPLPVKLDLNGGNWCLRGRCSSRGERGIGGREVTFEKSDAIFVIYDVPWSKQATDMNVWYGVIAASGESDSP